MTIEQPELLKEHGILHLSNFTAKDIESILAERYKKDVFISQCKNGETWGARDLLKLDGWVLLRTYSPLTTIGLEIKVSRQDFENDQKWTGYLDLCHMFYFVCPAGLIRATDLPSNIGIMWVSRNGKVHIKRQAERHEPNTEKLNRLLIYALMARSVIVSDMTETHKDINDTAVKQRLEWAKTCDEKGKLAEFVNGHIRHIYDDVIAKEKLLSDKESMIVNFKDRLAKLGIVWNPDTNDWHENMKVQEGIDMLRKNIDWKTIRNMKELSKLLNDVSSRIEELQNSKS